MAATLSINDFIFQLKESKKVLIDVRSEGEYEQGHIPGAKNIPLLNDEHRIIVGTTYKQQGREAAVRAGFDLVGKKFVEFIDRAKELTEGKEIYLYCWRGGMRSNIMAWVLNMAGYKIALVKGGYKAYRNWALQQFETPKNILILGGKTGSGKTEILIELKDYGEQIIDLEAIANHKGSAFGGLGQLPQPTQEHFENLLAWQWSGIEADKILWLENESRTIGHRKIPDVIFDLMRAADVIEVERNFEVRKERILNEYGIFTKEELAAKTNGVAKRLGGLRLKQALEFLDENDLNAWVQIMLDYYDHTYSHSNQLRDKSKTLLIEFENERSCKSIAEIVRSKKESSKAPNKIED
ncbi:MAG: tRNA 2-selenouridine(34) synthase MnmH [Bacteroidia bacterium]